MLRARAGVAELRAGCCLMMSSTERKLLLSSSFQLSPEMATTPLFMSIRPQLQPVIPVCIQICPELVFTGPHLLRLNGLGTPNNFRLNGHFFSFLMVSLLLEVEVEGLPRSSTTPPFILSIALSMTLACMHSSTLQEKQLYICTNFISIPCPRNSNSTFDSGLLSRTYQGISQELAPSKINEPETEHPVSRIRCHLVGRAEQGEFNQIARLEENVAWRDGVVYPPCVMEPIK